MSARAQTRLPLLVWCIVIINAASLINVFWLWEHKIPGHLTAPALSGNFSLKIIFDYGSGNQKFIILTKIFFILGAATKFIVTKMFLFWERQPKIYSDKNIFILGAATKNYSAKNIFIL